MNVPAYAKTVVAVLGAIAVSVGAAITDGVVTPAEWVAVALAVLTALGVYAVPNQED